eukprot:CAMPEP_0176495516 /NCGR_PEP_ID=MMETSP0200_2-20121128/10697_1 /TAXON_ID=947934 /ORGANISM="Chaetoceros sp., Strain GSL56" /LENGTH=599 /DNA_ID=CAMNT_0017893397 /DNA_START=313 /DNA_END=2112 /DNA_ORIENTATION=-
MTTTKPPASPLVLRFVDKINLVSLLSGTFSFCSSLLVATMIHKAGSGLSTSYRRIIFCLSVSDVIQSIAVMLGPFLLPKSTTATAAGSDVEEDSSTRSSWAFGNVHTCDFQGFILTFGATTTCMYTLFLCLYYYCKLKRGMSDDAFKDKIEKKMHCFIPLFNLLVCSIALGTKTFNPLPEGAGSCQIMRKPDGCDPNIPDSCERGQFAFKFGLFYFPVGVPCLCILGTIVFMFSIVVHVVKRDHRFRQDRTIGGGGGGGGGSKLDDNTNSNTTTTGSTAVRRQEETEADRVARLLRREVTLQVILYVLAFLLAYGWIVVLSFQSRANNTTPSVFVGVMVALFFPSMGILNILIYTRPQIVAYRRLHSDTSWPVAFWRVLRAGGENPDSSLSSPISSPRSARWCQGDRFSSVCRKYDKERNSERDVASGILRVMAIYNNQSSKPSEDPALKNQKKRRRRMKKKADSLGTNSIEQRMSMESNVLEHDTEEGWKEDDGGRSKNLENNEFQSVDVVRHISLLASQKSAISKAFEKASERAKTLNVEGVLDKKDVGIASDSEQSSNRIHSEWSCGVSPGSLIDHSSDNLSLENDTISGEWTNIE